MIASADDGRTLLAKADLSRTSNPARAVNLVRPRLDLVCEPEEGGSGFGVVEAENPIPPIEGGVSTGLRAISTFI